MKKQFEFEKDGQNLKYIVEVDEILGWAVRATVYKKKRFFRLFKLSSDLYLPEEHNYDLEDIAKTELARYLSKLEREEKYKEMWERA